MIMFSHFSHVRKVAENMDGWEGANASCTVSLFKSDGEGGDRATASGFTVSWQQLCIFIILTKFLQVHKLSLSWSVSSNRQIEVLGWRWDEFHAAEGKRGEKRIKLIASKVSDGAILLEKHNLYESGHVCICKHVRPPLLSAFVYSLSAREREKDADELFVWTNQEITLSYFAWNAWFFIFLPPSFCCCVSRILEKGHGKVFPSEQRSAIKHK